MADLGEINRFPNPGVRLVREDEHVAVWEEIFEPGKPTPPHRHMRDYIAIFSHGGELTVHSVAGDPESYTFIAGGVETETTKEGAMRALIPAGTILHSQVPTGGHAHFAVNEGRHPLHMILIELKSSAPNIERS